MEFNDEQSKLILEYFPYLKDVDSLVPILKLMGLTHHNIAEILSKGSWDTFVRVIDPDTDTEHLVYTMVGAIRYSLRLKDDQWQIYINDKPYKEFFTELNEKNKKPLIKRGDYLDEVSENIVYHTAIEEFKKTDPEAYERFVAILLEKGEIFIKR